MGTDVAERPVRFLEEALYLHAAERFVPGPPGLAGVLGEPFDPPGDTALREVKAVTCHGATVRRDNAGVSTTLVLEG